MIYPLLKKFQNCTVLVKTALLQKRVDEIARLSEMRKKEHERSFGLVSIHWEFTFIH